MAKFLAFAHKAKTATKAARSTKTDNQSNGGPWVPGTAAYKTSTLEISISCRNLADRDVLTKSDPLVVMFTRPPATRPGAWVETFRTEVINNDLNPDFAKKAIIPYHFERDQTVRFEVYDVDSNEHDLEKHDKLGYVETTLGQIVTAGTEGLIIEMPNFKGAARVLDCVVPQGPQKIILTAEELACEKSEVTLRLCGNKCGKWSGFLPPKTYLAISKVNDAGRHIVVHRSKPARGTSPHWPAITISTLNLCNGDHDRELKIEVWQTLFSGKSVLVGSLSITLREMLKASNNDALKLSLPTGEETNGVIRVLSCKLQPTNTFIEYMQGGTEIQCCFAIDFTCSNGDPEDPVSLHHVSNDPNSPNPYEEAMRSVGGILKDHTRNQFAAYGFGARIPPVGDTSHNFPLTLKRNPLCDGVYGVIEAYRSCLKKIMLYAPTNFAPIIKAVTKMASKRTDGSMYYILVIVTDGVITDLQKTKKAIVEASEHPVSIVIIGVGEADFDAMNELDSDGVRLRYGYKKAKRDIVQFVAYRSSASWLASTGEVTGTDVFCGSNVLEESAQTLGSRMEDLDLGIAPVDGEAPPIKEPAYFENEYERTKRLAQSHLASEVLAEIPEQIVSYMKHKGIKPGTVQNGVPTIEASTDRSLAVQ